MHAMLQFNDIILATCLAVIWYYSNSCRCPATKLMHLFSLYFQLFCTGWAKVNDATLHFCLQQLNASIRTFSLFRWVIITGHMLSWQHLACNNHPPVSVYWRNNKYDWIQRSNECRSVCILCPIQVLCVQFVLLKDPST